MPVRTARAQGPSYSALSDGGFWSRGAAFLRRRFARSASASLASFNALGSGFGGADDMADRWAARRLVVKVSQDAFSGFAFAKPFAIRPLPQAGRRSSVVERIIGNAEVGSSILPGGTIFSPYTTGASQTPSFLGQSSVIIRNHVGTAVSSLVTGPVRLAVLAGSPALPQSH